MNHDHPLKKSPKRYMLLYFQITGLPFKCKKKDIKEFFRPLVPYSIRLPLGKEKRLVGFCYVGFRTEKELNKALSKDKLFLGNFRDLTKKKQVLYPHIICSYLHIITSILCPTKKPPPTLYPPYINYPLLILMVCFC